jgi:hypothetical protein
MDRASREHSPSVIVVSGRSTSAPRYNVGLTVDFNNPTTGESGAGLTVDLSREDLQMRTGADILRVGDPLCFLINFPGTGLKRGAVAICCGRVTRVETVGQDGLRTVAVTIDRHHLGPANKASVRAARALGHFDGRGAGRLRAAS